MAIRPRLGGREGLCSRSEESSFLYQLPLAVTCDSLDRAPSLEDSWISECLPALLCQEHLCSRWPCYLALSHQWVFDQSHLQCFPISALAYTQPTLAVYLCVWSLMSYYSSSPLSIDGPASTQSSPWRVRRDCGRSLPFLRSLQPSPILLANSSESYCTNHESPKSYYSNRVTDVIVEHYFNDAS